MTDLADCDQIGQHYFDAASWQRLTGVNTALAFETACHAIAGMWHRSQCAGAFESCHKSYSDHYVHDYIYSVD